MSLASNGALHKSLAHAVLPIPFAEGSGKASNQINFDDTAAGQMRDPHRGPCGELVGLEIFGRKGR